MGGWNDNCAALLWGAAAIGLSIVTARALAREERSSPWSYFALFSAGQALAALTTLASGLGYLAAGWARPIGVLAVVGSLFALAEAGRRFQTRRISPWCHLALVLLASAGLATGTWEGLERATWLAIGVPAAALAAFGLRRQLSHGPQASSRTAWLAAICLTMLPIAGFAQAPNAIALLLTFALAGIWGAARSNDEYASAYPKVFDRRIAAVFCLVVAAGCWGLSGAPAEEVVVVAKHTARQSAQWDQSVYNRWEAAAPVLIGVALIPFVLGALSWICAQPTRRTTKPRVR